MAKESNRPVATRPPVGQLPAEKRGRPAGRRTPVALSDIPALPDPSAFSGPPLMPDKPLITGTELLSDTEHLSDTALMPNAALLPDAALLPGTPVLPGVAEPDSGRYRRPLTTLMFLLVLTAALALAQYVGGQPVARPGAAPAPTLSSPAASVRVRTDSTSAGAPAAGTSGHFTYAKGFGPVLGAAGPLHRFKVAVEKPTGPDVATRFADSINRTLGDRRSWIAGGRLRLQRVPDSAHAEFTIFLASARTSRKMCAHGGLETDGYTSCRLPRQVIVNDDRWESAIRGYGAPLAVYRAYAINHEVGHQLGHGHEACPGKGRPAPVMMQQTYGLKGCVANSWPFLNGSRYAGRPVP